MIQEWLGWYLAPWRRMGRVEFGIFTLLATLPGFLLTLVGWADGASGWLAPVMGLMDLGQQLQQGMAGDVGQQIESLGHLIDTPRVQAPVAAVSAVDWGGLLNNLLQLAMLPLCRMRLRDMGKEWPQELIWAIVFNITAVYGVVGAFGVDGLPLAWGFSALSFIGFVWLCVAPSTPRVAPYERIPGRQDP